MLNAYTSNSRLLSTESSFSAHEPVFAQAISHAWTPRKLMGLPECFTRCAHEEGISEATKRLLGASRTSLATTVEEADAALHVRIAAGRLLALVGDPRICPFSPRMIELRPPNPVTLGLGIGEASRVHAQNASLGVELPWIEKECPEYTVTLAPYRIGAYPVTHLEYALFLEDTGYMDIPHAWQFGRYPQEKSNHPVHTIRPESADAYACWLASMTGRRFRLPSEAEWEYAAGGPGRLEYPWGTTFDCSLANTVELGFVDTTPVGCFAPGKSTCGAHDMAGNVEEYVADTYSPYPGGRVIDDHLYRISARYRIARGGSFARFRDLARTRRRHGWNPESPVYVMGFRLAEDL